MQTCHHHIAGQSFAGGDPRPIVDPATGQRVGRVPVAGRVEVDAAVDAAVEAWPSWAALSLSKRQQVLRDYAGAIRTRIPDLAKAISREHGKTIEDATGEVVRGIEIVDHACGLTSHLKGERSVEVSTGVDLHSSRHPIGVCLGITPFNFPAMVPLWMFPVAIAAGNTFVLKPSEQDPTPAVLLAQLFEESGLPPGVLNVVHGDATTARLLLEHKNIQAVSFVGSTPVARTIYETGARMGKRVQALGGAKNHMVVMPDADLDMAADAAASAAFGSAGQRCMAVSVVVAVGACADGLADRLATRARQLRVGPYTDADADLGPMISPAARDRAVTLIEEAVEQGATLRVDGRELVEQPGFYLGPCVLDRVRPDMAVYEEEVFGPVLAVVRVESLHEALSLIQQNPYGNGASIFTQNGATARLFETQVDAGMVGINVPIPVPLGFYSFGGWGQSLFGAHHIYGPEGFGFYTRGKAVTTRWPPGDQLSGIDMGFAPVH